ncbi:MAG: cobalamin biosynthesis protein CbiG, partial [Phenylobacterium zucineum]
HFAKLDEAGKLGALFDAPKGLSDEALEAAATEEGWILGA